MNMREAREILARNGYVLTESERTVPEECIRAVSEYMKREYGWSDETARIAYDDDREWLEDYDYVVLPVWEKTRDAKSVLDAVYAEEDHAMIRAEMGLR